MHTNWSKNKFHIKSKHRITVTKRSVAYMKKINVLITLVQIVQNQNSKL